MQRRKPWLFFAGVVVVAGTIAWMIWSDREEIEPPAESHTLEVASEGNASRPAGASGESLVPGPLARNEHNDSISPTPSFAPFTNRAGVPTPAMDREFVDRSSPIHGESRNLSPRTLEGGSVNPIDGTPMREVVGIGAVLVKENGALKIKDVLPGSPAAFASLTGFTIKSVDGVDLTSLPLAECVQLIRGDVDTTIKLELLDPDGQPVTRELLRNRMQLKQQTPDR